MSVLSLYIPVIGENVSESYMKKMFDTHKIGKVMRVDFVKNIGKNRREAFVHFDEWFNTDESKQLQEDVLNPDKQARFVYYNKKFWPLLVNKNSHRRVKNPNYEVLNKNDVKIVYKTSLKLIKPEKTDSSSDGKKPRIMVEVETYADKVSSNLVEN